MRTTRPVSYAKCLLSRRVVPCAAGFLAAWLASVAPAAAESRGACRGIDEAQTSVVVTESKGGANVAIAGPASRRGRPVRIYYDDETYFGRFDNTGRAVIRFALVSPENRFSVSIEEMPEIDCRLPFPEIAQIYRVILRWRSRVRVDLHVIEPGSAFVEPGSTSGARYGHIHADRPNANRDQGIGQIDVVTDAIDDDATGEQSYVVEESERPRGSTFTFRWYYASRGMVPQLPYCGTGALATVRATRIVLDHGQVARQGRDLGSVPCGQPLSDPLQRYQRLR